MLRGDGPVHDDRHAEIDRTLTLEVARVTEVAAVAAARFRGRGDEQAADRAATEAMHAALGRLRVDGAIVIGEGDRVETDLLWLGEKIGAGHGPLVDIAVDPLEGVTMCAKAMPDSLAVIAVAQRDSFLHAPGIYMEKIAIGPGYADGLVDLDRTPGENLEAVAAAKGAPISEITVCVLDRPRHAKLVEDVRAAGAALKLIGDGDIAGVINAAIAGDTGIDMYMGVGGAPEGVLAAAALRCIGGQMQGRLRPANDEQRRSAHAAGFDDPDRKYGLTELCSGDVIFAATGVTDGSLLRGVRFTREAIVTESVVMRAATRTVRWIRSEHRDREKFD
jgi:fructose-1,6-bisphosphatase II / sedoheptulose-1,7-bisphosphatase